MTPQEKAATQEKIRQLAEAARLKSELEASGVLKDPLKPKK